MGGKNAGKERLERILGDHSKWIEVDGDDGKKSEMKRDKTTTITLSLVPKRENRKHSRNVEGHESFAHDKNKDGKIKKERYESGREAVMSEQSSNITFFLPNSYGVILVGRVITLIGFLAEGVRLSLTDDFESMEELAARAMNPELFEAQHDKYAAKIAELSVGSVAGGIEIIDAVGRVILELSAVWVAYKVGARQLRSGNRTSSVNHALKIISSDNMPEELKQKAYEVIKNNFGVGLDKKDMRTKAATSVVDYFLKIWMAIRGQYGGEIMIDGKPILLPDEEVIDAEGHGSGNQDGQKDK